MTYRSEIDGLRAIAVLYVLLYHAKFVIFGIERFQGGFIGVDIFFVISGYLITYIILTELQKNHRFNLLAFYDRRARRILPMLFLVLTACLPFAWHYLLPLDLVNFAQSSLSAIGFSSNIFFYFSTTEYGADSAQLKPLLHTWSLGVEEQFYILLPLALPLLWKRAPKAILPIFFIMAYMSLHYAQIMQERDSQLNFFLPFSRFWELLAGSLLAYKELKYGRYKQSIATQIIPIIGAILIVYSLFYFNADTPHPSLKTLIPVFGVMLLIAFCSGQDLISKILSAKPLVSLGLLSYSLYLWHFPIFAFGRIHTTNPSNGDKLGWIALALLLAIFSFFCVERVFRNRARISSKTFYATLLAALCVLLFININFITHAGYKSRIPAILSKEDLDVLSWEIFKQDGKLCLNRRSDFCHIHHDEANITVHALGDSHFSAFSPQLQQALATDFNYIEANRGGCPFVLNVNQITLDGTRHHECHVDTQKMRYESIPETPSIILFGGRFPLYLSSRYFDNQEGGVEGDVYDLFQPIHKESFEDAIRQTIELLLKEGHEVILLYPIPEVGVHVPKHIFNALKGSRHQTNKNFSMLTTSYDVYLKRSEASFKLFDSISAPNLHRVYPHTLYCDQQIKGRCITHDKENVFYADDDHPSGKGAEKIVNLLMEKIKIAEQNILSKAQ